MLFRTVASAICASGAVSLSQGRQLQSETSSPSPEAAPSPVRGLGSLLWDGIDILEADDVQKERYHFELMPASTILRHDEVNKTRPKKLGEGNSTIDSTIGVQVIGLQDTGTNLLTGLLIRNFANQVTLYDSAFVGEMNGVWKHANLHLIDKYDSHVYDNLKQHKVVPLVVVRNPLSWLMSIKKAPYELEDCVEGDNWLTKPCIHPHPAGYTEGAPNSTKYSHLSAIWGRWTSTYRKSLKKNFPNQHMILTYEDLVMHTDDVVKNIATYLNLSLPETIDEVDDPAKDHGEAVGHDEAVAKIANKTYLDEYVSQQVDMVCHQLRDYQWYMEKYNYLDCFLGAAPEETTGSLADLEGDAHLSSEPGFADTAAILEATEAGESTSQPDSSMAAIAEHIP